MSSATLGPDAARVGKDEINAARRLAEALDNGGWLRPIAVEDAPLDPGEEAYADLLAHGWRYHAIDAQYDHRTVMFGGPFLFAATALASCAANRRRRREAERLAAPQWRPLGQLRVVVTARRLLVLHQGNWWSVWYTEIEQVRAEAAPSAVTLTFRVDAPYQLQVSEARSLALVIDHLRAPRRRHHLDASRLRESGTRGLRRRGW